MLGHESISESPLSTLPGAASSAVNYTLSCAAGSYTYTGVAATLTVQRNYTLVCAAGSYSYTGVAATLDYVAGGTPIDYTLTCAAGSYTYTGNDATLTYVSGVAASRLKYWDGAAWQIKTLKYWDGGTWATKTLKYWDGGAWLP